MPTDEIRQVIERHSCSVHGARYTFAVQWTASEKRGGAAPARVLVGVRASTGSASSHTPEVLLQIAASHGAVLALPSLLTDALHHQLDALSPGDECVDLDLVAME